MNKEKLKAFFRPFVDFFYSKVATVIMLISFTIFLVIDIALGRTIWMIIDLFILYGLVQNYLLITTGKVLVVSLDFKREREDS